MPDAHNESMRAYGTALAELYGGVADGPTLAALADQPHELADDEALFKRVDAASEAAGESVARLLDDDRRDVREVAEAQLAALAARDFAIATDAAQRDEDESGRAEVAAATGEQLVLPQVDSDLRFVLEADPSQGLSRLHETWEGMAEPSSGGDSEATLNASIEAAIDSVQGAVWDVLKDGTGRLVSGTGLGDALSRAAAKAFDHLPDGARRWAKRAVAAFRRGVEKLKKLFGDWFDRAVDKVTEWLQGEIGQALLGAIYGTKALQADLKALVAAKKSGKDLDALAKAVSDVADRYGTQKKILLWVFKAIGYVRKWVVNAFPQAGAPAVAAAFGLGIVYAVYSGGDYIDWKRIQDEGLLDRVKGIRRTVEDGLG